MPVHVKVVSLQDPDEAGKAWKDLSMLLQVLLMHLLLSPTTSRGQWVSDLVAYNLPEHGRSTVFSLGAQHSHKTTPYQHPSVYDQGFTSPIQ